MSYLFALKVLANFILIWAKIKWKRINQFTYMKKEKSITHTQWVNVNISENEQVTRAKGKRVTTTREKLSINDSQFK